MNLIARVARVAIGCFCVLSFAPELRGQSYYLIGMDETMINPDFQSPALCEASCFAATYRFSTVPYYSLDQPRNVTLVYNGDQAAPRPFIYADVWGGISGSGYLVSQYTMSATLNGTAVTFLNGQTLLTFGGPSTGGYFSTRLAGQFDARGYSTDVYPLVITVRATFPDGGSSVTTRSTQMMIVNEAASPIAKGWTVEGLQRLRTTTSPGYMITNGDGSATRFPSLGVIAADFTTLTYTANGAFYTRTYSDGSRAFFNSLGAQTSLIDSDGRTSTFSYDAQGRIQDIGDPYRKQPNGALTSIGLWYDVNGLRGIQEPGPDGTPRMGRTTVFTVNTSRCLVNALDPDNKSTIFTCDSNGRLATIKDRRLGVTTLVYNANSWKVSQLTLPSVPVDAGAGKTTTKNPVVNYSPWQTQGVPTSVTSPTLPWTAPVSSSVVGSVTDPVGRKTSFTVNRYGQATDLTDPAGRHTMISWTRFLPTVVSHFTGAFDLLEYDASGRLTMSHPGAQPRVDYSYGTNGRLHIVTGLGIGTDTVNYDANNQVSQIVHGGGPTRQVNFTYDPSTKRVTSVTDNAGHTKTYAYDSVFGNVGQTNLPGGRTTSRSYDAIGRVRTVQSLGSALQTTDYDILNRPTAIYDGVNATPTRIAYDALFSTSVTDPKNQIYKNDNNALGWVVRQYDPNTSYGSKLMRYDASGRLTGLTNRRGQKLIFSYDVLDRLLSKTGTNVSPETFSYAADGRTAVASSTVETDSLFVNPITGADSTVIVLAGRRFRIAHTSHNELSLPDTTNISNTAGLAFYDRIFSADQSTGALGSLTLGGTQVQFSYNSDGLRSTNSFNNQSQTYTSIHTILEQSYGYNSLHRRAYHYDLAGRIDVQQREGEPWGTYTAIERTFGYDQLGRLTRVETRQEPGCLQWPGGFYDQDSLSAANGWRFTCGSHAPTTDAFSYDAVGNRTDNGASSIVGNRYATLNGVTYTYDLDGNVTKKSKPGLFTRSYVWSAENRLLSAVDGTATVRYEYNAYGQPVVKWVGSGGSEHIDRFFIWDGEQLLAILDSALQRLEEYTYGFGIDEPVVFMSSWETRAPVQDALGNFRGFGDQSIFDTQVTNYDTWGTPTVTGPQSMSLLWKGLLWEGDVAHLYYARNRWYDPDAGRFMSEDPVGISAGLNQYVFANNDPVNGRDPSGLNAWITCEYTPGYETGTNPVISYAGTWQCYGGGGSTDSESQSGPSSYDPGHGGGGGSGGSGKPLPPKPGTDVGQHAERVCQAAIGLTAASFFLETVGAIQLYKGVKGIAAARGAAQFAETFTHPVPDAIRAYTRGRARAAEWSTAREYASGWAHGGLISYFGEAATGAEHTWWGYLPLPYASTASFGKATALACFYPGGN